MSAPKSLGAAVVAAIGLFMASGPAFAQGLAITRIQMAGHGVITGSSGLDAPPVGAQDFITADIVFSGPPYMYTGRPGGYFYSNVPGNPGYGLNFHQKISDDYVTLSAGLVNDGMTISATPSIDVFSLDSRTLLSQGIDQDILLQHCCDASGWYAFGGQFHTAAGDNIFGGDWFPDSIVITLANIPEPSTWVLMLAAFMGCGVVFRRRGEPSWLGRPVRRPHSLGKLGTRTMLLKARRSRRENRTSPI